MRNTIKLLGIIALVAVIGFSMTACDQALPTTDDPDLQTVITITGLSEHIDKYAYAGLGSDEYKKNVGFTVPKKITEGSMEFKLIDENKKAISVQGSVTLILIISKTSDTKQPTDFEGFTIDTVKKGNTTIKFSDFEPIPESQKAIWGL
jgi:hypothetical protein